MYSNELVWYFHHLHEANVRTEDPRFILVIISPSLPLVPQSFFFSLPLFVFLPVWFSLPPFLILFIFQCVTNT